MEDAPTRQFGAEDRASTSSARRRRGRSRPEDARQRNRAGLENRPDSRAGFDARGPQAFRTPVGEREVVVDVTRQRPDNSSRRLTPANSRRPSRCASGDAELRRDGDGRQGFRKLYAPTAHLKLPNGTHRGDFEARDAPAGRGALPVGSTGAKLTRDTACSQRSCGGLSAPMISVRDGARGDHRRTPASSVKVARCRRDRIQRVTTAMSGRYFRNFAVLSKKALSYSSPSMTKSRPCPRR